MSVDTELHIDGEQVAEAVRTREVLVRTYAVEAQDLDGRNLHVRVVPFDEVATVADPPDFQPYKEQFRPGVFRAQENAAHRIRLRSDHAAIDGAGSRKAGLAGVVGKGVSLRETNGGAEMEFRFLNTPDADTALELVREGGYDGVSAEFMPIRSERTQDGVLQRVKAHLDSVALALGPAYSKAEILALRESPEVIVDAAMLPPEPSVALLERCAGLGIELPSGMATLLARAFTEQPWDGSASRWDTAEAYCAASAIDLNTGSGPKSKALCHLPYMEPGSMMVNVNGVRAALSRLGEGFPSDASAAQRDEARVMLEKVLASFNA